MLNSRPIVGLGIGFLIGFGASEIWGRMSKSSPTINNSQESISQVCMQKNETDVTANESKLLDPPEFKSEDTEDFKVNSAGEAYIRWRERSGAKKYKIFIESLDGKTVKTYQSVRTFTYLKDIPIPEGSFKATYNVRLASINSQEKIGPKGEPKTLHAQAGATLTAPQIKEIKIED